VVSTFRPNWQPRSVNQLIVESWHDGAFIDAVARHYGAPRFDYTAPIGDDGRPLGKSGFKRHLVGMLFWTNQQKVRNIIVSGDNDDDHASALTEVRRAIQDARGYPTPDVQPCKIATKGDIRIGILMLPESGKNGCLETRLLASTVKNQTAMACVDTWATCCGFPKHRRNDYDKFQLRSLLAATIHSDPNLTLSAIWQKAENPINAGDPEFAWIADFLKVAFV
jgi:hypothetical protein